MAQVKRVPAPAEALLKVALAQLDGVKGKVGWFETAHYANGVPVALIAAVNEFGWPEHNIPPRLGMRATAQVMKPIWAKIAYDGSKRVLKGELTGVQMMEIIGLKAAGDFRKHISTVWEPPLKQSTIAHRQSSRGKGKKSHNLGEALLAIGGLTKPLVVSGHMLNTLTNTTEHGK